MRRAEPRGRRGNLTRAPLLTDDLLQLKEIDLELALLKKKRQILEEQQHLVNDNEQQYYRPSNYYEHPSYDRHFTSNRVFSNMYKEPRESGAGQKRHVRWEDELPPKRFSGPKGDNVRKTFSSRLGLEPIPMVGSTFQTTQPDYRGFHLVGNQPGPSKRGRSRWFPRRPQPLMSQKFKPMPSPNVPKADKDLKSNNKEKSKQTLTPAETFRNLYVTLPSDRKNLVAATPSATEGDVASNSAVLRADVTPTQQVTGRLELALGRIMKEIKETYENRYYDIFVSTRYQRIMKQAIRERIKVVMLGKAVGSAIEILNEYRAKFPTETDKDIVEEALAAEGPKVLMTPLETDNPLSFFKYNMHKLVDMKLNEMFTKMEEIYRAEYNKPEESVPLPDVAKALSKENTAESSDFTSDVNVVHTKKSNDDLGTSVPVKYKFIEKLISQKIPMLLKKYIPYIIKQMKLDYMYEETIAAIKAETLNKVSPKQSKWPKTNKAASNAKNNTEKAKVENPTVSNILPYYVKVLGRPYLPKKNAMQQFLHQFNPKSIKKHKNVNNLLFVGFDNRNDFDNILAATGSSVGRFNLDIKISERTHEKLDGPKVTDGDTKTSGIKITVNFTKPFEDKTLNPELDNQITNLLSAIRKADEQEKAKVVSIETHAPTEETNNDNKEVVPTTKETIDVPETTTQIQTDSTEAVGHEDTPSYDEIPKMNLKEVQQTIKCEEKKNEDVKEQEEVVKATEENADEPKDITDQDTQESAPTVVTGNAGKIESVEETNVEEGMKEESVEALNREEK